MRPDVAFVEYHRHLGAGDDCGQSPHHTRPSILIKRAQQLPRFPGMACDVLAPLQLSVGAQYPFGASGIKPQYGPQSSPRYGGEVLWPVAQRAARSLTIAMKYAPFVLVMRRSWLAWRVSEMAIQRSPSGCSRIIFR